jgi:thymidylate synthase (FAD)
MVDILDSGYVKLVEHWGSDERIIESARMSVNRGFKRWGNKEKPGDEVLLEYLYTNKHSTPFEMAGMTFEIKAPIFVFRQWHRHRTQSYNEMSARYTPLPDENYIPSVERLMIDADKENRQAGTVKGAAVLTEKGATLFQQDLAQMYEQQDRFYREWLKLGIPKELARLHLPFARYSKMRASANLRNWLGFLTLRMAEDAQWEIRQYANAIHKICTELFPRTVSLFDGERCGN